MKKKLGKIFLAFFCFALVLFLLLPFLETPAPSSATPETPKAAPQIFTSNPLTELVNRIARFFGRTSSNKPQEGQTLTAQEVRERFGVAQEGPVVADARAAVNTPLEQESANPTATTTTNFDYEPQSGTEWVLIRQTMPEGASAGMHEINAHDNAYDTYVKQERTARFTPTAQPQKTKEVPASRLARLFRPIKEFFGWEESAPLRISSAQQEGSAARLTRSFGLGSSRNEAVSGARRTPDLWGIAGRVPDFTPDEEKSVQQKADETQSLLSFLDPINGLEKLSKDMVDNLFPPPLSKEQEAQRNALIRYLEEQRGGIVGKINNLIASDAKGKEPTDLVSKMLQENSPCGKETPSVTHTGNTCPVRSNLEESLEAWKKQNKETLFNGTGPLLREYFNRFQELPVTVVAGTVDTNTLLNLPLPDASTTDDEEEDKDTQKARQTAQEFYQFMAEQKGCGNNNCFWVANNTPQNTDLKTIVSAANVTYRGDPLGKFDQLKQSFLQKKIAELGNNATPEKIKQLTQELEQNTPPYLVYSAQEITQLQRNTRDAMKNVIAMEKVPENSSLLYISSAADAQVISRTMQNENLDPFLTYNKDGGASLTSDLQQSSHAMTEDFIRAMNFGREVLLNAERNANKEGISLFIKAAADSKAGKHTAQPLNAETKTNGTNNKKPVRNAKQKPSSRNKNTSHNK